MKTVSFKEKQIILKARDIADIWGFNRDDASYEAIETPIS